MSGNTALPETATLSMESVLRQGESSTQSIPQMMQLFGLEPRVHDDMEQSSTKVI